MRDVAEDRVIQVAAGFAAIASCIEERGSDDALIERLRTTKVACEQAVAAERSAERKRLLTEVQPALETWRDVWPRLGTKREFRLAVTREARLWSKRFSGSP